MTKSDIIHYLCEPTDLPWLEALTQKDQEKGRERLLLLLDRAKEVLPLTKIECDRRNTRAAQGDNTYLTILYRIKKYLDAGDWYNACRDCGDVLHWQCGYDRRTIYTLICILEAFECFLKRN